MAQARKMAELLEADSVKVKHKYDEELDRWQQVVGPGNAQKNLAGHRLKPKPPPTPDPLLAAVVEVFPPSSTIND